MNGLARRTTRLLTLLALAAACNSDALQPADVAGDYSATTFTIDKPGQATIDAVAGGAALTITLLPDGVTAGGLSIPPTITGGQTLIASMEGTFTISGKTINIDQSADTFVRDMPFTITGNTLVGSGTFSGTTIHVTLTRQ